MGVVGKPRLTAVIRHGRALLPEGQISVRYCLARDCIELPVQPSCFPHARTQPRHALGKVCQKHGGASCCRAIAEGQLAPGSHPPTQPSPQGKGDGPVLLTDSCLQLDAAPPPSSGGGWEGVCSTLQPICNSPALRERAGVGWFSDPSMPPVSPDKTLIRVSGHLACAAPTTRFAPL